MSPLELEIHKRLVESDLPARAFAVHFDADVGRDLAWIMYGLENPQQDTWQLAETDDLCERAADLLDDLVGFVYCEYRTESDATAAIRAERGFGWRELPSPHAAPAA